MKSVLIGLFLVQTASPMEVKVGPNRRPELRRMKICIIQITFRKGTHGS